MTKNYFEFLFQLKQREFEAYQKYILHSFQVSCITSKSCLLIWDKTFQDSSLEMSEVHLFNSLASSQCVICRWGVSQLLAQVQQLSNTEFCLTLHTSFEATHIRWLGYTFRLICLKGGQVKTCMKLLIHGQVYKTPLLLSAQSSIYRLQMMEVQMTKNSCSVTFHEKNMDKDHLAFCKVQWKKGLTFAKYQHNSNHI